MALTLDEANRMVQAAINKAKELNVNVSIAVCDAGGHLLAFSRMESCIWISSSVAQGKATAAVAFGQPSGDIEADSPVIQTIMAAQGGRMLASQGGVPIFREGQVIGSIAECGATSQQDEECAQAGLAAL